MNPVLTWSVVGALAVVFVAGFWLDGLKETSKYYRHRRWSLVLQLGAMALAVAVLRPGEGTHRTAEAFHGAIGHGTPALIDVYSNW